MREHSGVAIQPGPLPRGYSLTARASGELLRNARDAQDGEALRTTLSSGWVESTVTRRG